MVYTKDDGSHGFSWEQHYDFLLREHPEDLENIAQSKFSLLKIQKPDKTEYYEALKTELNERIAETWDNNPNFGYKESDEVVKAFIKDKHLEELFSDVDALSCTDEEILDFSVQDDDLDYLSEL